MADLGGVPVLLMSEVSFQPAFSARSQRRAPRHGCGSRSPRPQRPLAAGVDGTPRRQTAGEPTRTLGQRASPPHSCLGFAVTEMASCAQLMKVLLKFLFLCLKHELFNGIPPTLLK